MELTMTDRPALPTWTFPLLPLNHDARDANRKIEELETLFNKERASTMAFVEWADAELAARDAEIARLLALAAHQEAIIGEQAIRIDELTALVADCSCKGKKCLGDLLQHSCL